MDLPWNKALCLREFPRANDTFWETQCLREFKSTLNSNQVTLPPAPMLALFVVFYITLHTWYLFRNLMCRRLQPDMEKVANCANFIRRTFWLCRNFLLKTQQNKVDKYNNESLLTVLMCCHIFDRRSVAPFSAISAGDRRRQGGHGVTKVQMCDNVE